MRIAGSVFAGLVVLLLVRNIAAVFLLLWAGYCLVMAGLFLHDVCWKVRRWVR